MPKRPAYAAKDYGYEKDIIKKTLEADEDKALDAEYDKLRNQQDFDYASQIKVETRELTEAQKARLRQQFDFMKLNTGYLPVNVFPSLLTKSGVEIPKKEVDRQLRMATIVSNAAGVGKKGLTYDQVCRISCNKIDVNMLHALFLAANTDVKYERVEFFLDTEEIQALLAKIDIKKTMDEVNTAIDTLDRDNDGRVDWEEFLSIAAMLIGSKICIDMEDPDGSEYNQLRDYTKHHLAALEYTNKYTHELFDKIEKKKREIQQKIEDTTLEDVRKKLKAAWDEKDRMELGILSLKVGHFNQMKDLLMKQDDEKQSLVNKFREHCHARDHSRRKIDSVRDKFSLTFKNLVDYEDINALLSGIKSVSQQVTDSLQKRKEDTKALKGVWAQVAKHEKPPAVSNSETALTFLSRQGRMIEEIKTKMRIMQRERDKYEDMIAEEMEKNKSKRIECVNLNSKITQLETKQMAMEAKQKEYKIQNQTLAAELKEKETDTDSKKVKQMKSIVFQFREENAAIQEQVERCQMQLRAAKKELTGCKKKTSRLCIELGELKILLEGVKMIDVLDDEAREKSGVEEELLKDMVAYSGPGPDMPAGK